MNENIIKYNSFVPTTQQIDKNFDVQVPAFKKKRETKSKAGKKKESKQKQGLQNSSPGALFPVMGWRKSKTRKAKQGWQQ